MLCWGPVPAALCTRRCQAGRAEGLPLPGCHTVDLAASRVPHGQASAPSLSHLVLSAVSMAPAAPAAPTAPAALHPATSGLALAAAHASPAAPHPAPGDVLSPGWALCRQAALHGAACPGRQGAGESHADTGGQIRQFSRAWCVVLHLLRWRLSYPGP